jgi:putative hemolysin
MSLRKLIVAAAFAVLAACAQTVATQGIDSPDLANCAARGGVVDTVGRLQRQVCRVPYADAGETCSNKSDCAARCILDREEGDTEPANGAVTGKCQQYATQFGCFSEVDGGKVISTICVD